MPRAATITSRLPRIYRDGEVIGTLAGNWGVQLDGLDEASASVQRDHWFDATPDDAAAVALARVLDIAPEEFHANLAEFRAWVHAVRDGILREGSVTAEALRILVDEYAQGFQQANGIQICPPIKQWAKAPDRVMAALVENPTQLRTMRLPATDGIEPLARLVVANRGLDPAPWAVVLFGTEGGSEYAPFVANRTTGHAIVYRGTVDVGQVLVIAPGAEDRTSVRAVLNGVDVTERLDTYPSLVPGPDGPGGMSETPQSSLLARGDNEFWFLPLAHYQTPGLGRFLLALADDALRTGRFDSTVFDDSLFAQRPEVGALIAWVEARPAAFEIHLPAHALFAPPNGTVSAMAAKDRLELGLDVAVSRAAAVGVEAEVTLDTLAERQPGRDRLVAAMPRVINEVGPTGADRLTNSSGAFDVTGYDESTLT